MWIAGNVLRDDVPLVFADVGQRPDAGDVPDRPHSLAGTHVLVNRDPVGIGLDPDGLEADPLDARSPTGGDQEPLAAHLPATLQFEDVLIALLPRGAGVRAEHQLDPVALQCLAEPLAEGRGLAREHPVGALDHHHLPAESPHDLRELDARGPSAQHDQAARNGLHARRLARSPDALQLPQPGDWRHERI